MRSGGFIGPKISSGYPNECFEETEQLTRKPHTPRDIAIAIVRHRPAMDGQIGCHFRDSGHDEVDEGGHDDVTDENEGRASQSKRLARPHEETRANGAPERYHLRMARLEASLGGGETLVKQVGGHNRCGDARSAVIEAQLPIGTMRDTSIVVLADALLRVKR